MLTGPAAELNITLSSALDQHRTVGLPVTAGRLSSTALSPDGATVAVTARGQLFALPAVGAPNRGRTVAAKLPGRVRDAVFLGEAGELLALSDQSGEQELWRVPTAGAAPPVQLTTAGRDRGQRQLVVPSPAGRLVAMTCTEATLTVLDVEKQSEVVVHTSDMGGHSDLVWSADGSWLAFAADGPNQFGQIYLWPASSTLKGEPPALPAPVTSARYPASSPVWSPDGSYLLFLSDRDLHNAVGSPWGIRAPEPAIVRSCKVYGLALTNLPAWPVWAAADELHPPAHKSGAEKKEEEEEEEAEGGTAAVAVEWWGGAPPAGSLLELPVKAGDFSAIIGLTAGWRLLLAEGGAIKAVDLANPKPGKGHELLTMAAAARAIAYGSRLLVSARQPAGLHVVDTAKSKAPFELGPETAVSLDGIRLAVEAATEWATMFDDAWRLQRDLFYDKGMHGLDWPAVKQRYEVFLPRVHDRRELNDLMAQMVGEISALHAFVRGGAQARPSMLAAEALLLRPAHLGGVFSRCSKGWRVDHVYRGDEERPGSLSPLAAFGCSVGPGDVITHVNGAPTAFAAHLNELLVGLAGQQVRGRTPPWPGSSRFA